MKVCPKCNRSAKVSERIEKDGKKHWLITFCAHCGYNYDLEEYKDEVLSPQQEMNKFAWSDPPTKKRSWPHE